MSETQQQPLQHQQLHQTSTTTPFHRSRSTPSIHNADGGDGGGGDTSSTTTSQHRVHHHHHHHKPHKQFVVSRHGHAGPRVPSYGRGLNKLGAGTGGAGKHGTSPKRTSSRRGATFELGSPNSDHGDEEAEEAEGDEEVIEETETQQQQQQHPPLLRNGSGRGIHRTDTHGLARNGSAVALTKSSSTRSLDQETRKQHRATRKGTSTEQRPRSKSGDRHKQQKQQDKKRAQSSDALAEMMARAVAAQAAHPRPPPSPPPRQPQRQPTPQQFRPPSPPEDPQPLTGTRLPPVTPMHSLPSSQQELLTSRFIHNSPSSGADSAPTKQFIEQSEEQDQQQPPPSLARSESAYSITSAARSRTQQKLWLQRASVNTPPPPSHVSGGRGGPVGIPAAAPATHILPHHLHSGGREWYHPVAPMSSPGPLRVEKEYDRVVREYANVRRFRNPLGEALERVREIQARRGIAVVKRPVTGDVGSTSGNAGLGLSRSLQEGETGRRKMLERSGASKDDLSVGSSSRQPAEVEQMLERMWRREVGAVSHE